MTDQAGRGGRLRPLEAEVMAVLWRVSRPMPVREVAEADNAGRGSPLAHTTVLRAMTRLAGKNILARSRSGRGYVYTPVAADTAEIAVRGVLGAGHRGHAQGVDRAHGEHGRGA